MPPISPAPISGDIGIIAGSGIAVSEARRRAGALRRGVLVVGDVRAVVALPLVERAAARRVVVRRRAVEAAFLVLLAARVAVRFTVLLTVLLAVLVARRRVAAARDPEPRAI